VPPDFPRPRFTLALRLAGEAKYQHAAERQGRVLYDLVIEIFPIGLTVIGLGLFIVFWFTLEEDDGSHYTGRTNHAEVRASAAKFHCPGG